MSLKSWDWELLVVSDGSIDRTEEVVRAFTENTKSPWVRLIASKENHGKGAAVRRGVLEARGDFILMTDVDLSSPIKEVDRLLAPLNEGYDVAIGSRAIRAEGCDVQQSFKRWFSGRIFNLIVRILILNDYADTQCGFKCFKKAAAAKLFGQQSLEGFSFDVEILLLAKKNGFKVKEVPVMWKEGADSRVRLLRDSIAMVKELFYLRSKYR